MIHLEAGEGMTGGCGFTGANPVRGHEDDLRTRAPDTGEALRAGAAQLDKRRLWKDLTNVHKHLMGGSAEDGARLIRESTKK